MTNNNQQATYLYNTVPTSEKTIQGLYLKKERLIVPIIFIPGVMGSNLKAKQKDSNNKTKRVWRLDNKVSVIGWSLPYYGDAKARKLELDPEKTEVDDGGTVVDAAAEEVARIKNNYHLKIQLLGDDKSQRNKKRRLNQEKQQEIQKAINNNPENRLFGSRQKRGWGTVGYISYGEFLELLQKILFEPDGHLSTILNDLIEPPSFSLDEGSKSSLELDEKQIKHCEKFYFPVYAMGYNWLESNEDSAKRLKRLVEVTIPAFYKKRGQICDKVILITHSMGGLVARYYTEALNGRNKVYGVINGVQPATGAVAAYTRMKRGTEVNGDNSISNFVTANVLGKDAAEMTAVCAQAPGPLQLLPTPEYGMGWLTITDPNGNPESYPKADPYAEIYLAKDKWWCACEPHLINPFNTDHNLQQMQDDWRSYKNIINKKVIPFNSAIANKYHPNTYAFFGLEEDDNNIKTESLTYQIAHWQGSVMVSKKKASANHIGDKNRLNLKELVEIRTLQNGDINEKYTLLPADGNGDGTVSQQSGEIPIDYLKARMCLPVGHEPAYKNKISREFTLRAIVDIMYKVKIND
jgi:hypothetical protein